MSGFYGPAGEWYPFAERGIGPARPAREEEEPPAAGALMPRKPKPRGTSGGAAKSVPSPRTKPVADACSAGRTV